MLQPQHLVWKGCWWWCALIVYVLLIADSPLLCRCCCCCWYVFTFIPIHNFSLSSNFCMIWMYDKVSALHSSMLDVVLPLPSELYEPICCAYMGRYFPQFERRKQEAWVLNMYKQSCRACCRTQAESNKNSRRKFLKSYCIGMSLTSSSACHVKL